VDEEVLEDDRAVGIRPRPVERDGHERPRGTDAVSGARSSSRQIREVLYALWPERRPYAEVKVEAATP